MGKRYRIELSEEERKRIHGIINSEATKQQIRKRASILLLADSSAGKPMTQAEMCIRCGVSDVTIFNTLRDFCTEGLEYTLKFKRTKVTNPPIVTGEKEARIVALACGAPPDGRSRWTVRLLTERVIELEIMEEVSRETVRTILKKHGLSLT